MNDITYKISGMHCDGCAARLAKLLNAADGVEKADASFADGETQIRFDPAKINETQIRAIVRKAGFDVVG